MNQAASFGLLGVGGILLTKALTGSSFADVVKGKPAKVATTGTLLVATAATTGVAGVGTAITGAAASAGTGPAGAQKMLAAAQAAIGGPYSVANHASAFDQIGSWLKAQGTDCSGFVSYLMGPQGAGLWTTSYATPGIPSAPNVTAGAGQYVTMWNNPQPGAAGHVFIEILGQWFESAGSTGIHQMSAGEAQNYISSGAYSPFHPTGM